MRFCLALAVAVLLLGWPVIASAQTGATAQPPAAAAPAQKPVEAAPVTPPAAAATAPAATPSTPQTAPAPSVPGTLGLSPEKVDEMLNAFAGLQNTFRELIAAARSMSARLGDGTQTMVLTTNQIFGIAIGATAGALVVDFLGGGGLATIGGAVAGGLGAHWLLSPLGPTATVPAVNPG
jgi:hypothetical protein